jgi:NhaP-type Na+/H+ or K+/H+ antiporter
MQAAGRDLSPHAKASLSLLLLVTVLAIIFLVAYVIREHHITFLHESSLAIALGLAIGAVVHKAAVIPEQLSSLVTFQQESFFLYLLPPIIFASGYNMRRRVFFANIDSILIFAFLGTIANTFAFAALIYAFGLLLLPLSFLDCLIFGSIISATDPVTVLAIFKQLSADYDLYANVFGESVLNDAVAIVLYRAMVSFLSVDVTAASVAWAVFQFMLIFLLSLMIGVAIGLWSALLFKVSRL